MTTELHFAKWQYLQVAGEFRDKATLTEAERGPVQGRFHDKEASGLHKNGSPLTGYL